MCARSPCFAFTVPAIMAARGVKPILKPNTPIKQAPPSTNWSKQLVVEEDPLFVVGRVPSSSANRESPGFIAAALGAGASSICTLSVPPKLTLRSERGVAKRCGVDAAVEAALDKTDVRSLPLAAVSASTPTSVGCSVAWGT